MPEKHVDSNAKTYYLDSSTLSDIHNAAIGVPQAEPFGPLVAWLAHIADEGNLCLSFVHAGECSDRPLGYCEAFAKWLDHFPYVWALSTEGTERIEVASLVWAAAGLGECMPLPFAPRGCSFAEMVGAAREAGWARAKHLPFEQTTLVRGDIAEITAAGVSDAVLTQERTRKRSLLVFELAVDAHADFILREGPEYITATVGRKLPEEAVRLFESDPCRLRTLRVSLAAAEEVGRNAQARKPGGRTEQAQLPGFTGDVLHAMAGAAYCDVFTCDAPTARWVAPLRAQFGLPPPIVLGGHPGGAKGFVEQLAAM